MFEKWCRISEVDPFNTPSAIKSWGIPPPRRLWEDAGGASCGSSTFSTCITYLSSAFRLKRVGNTCIIEIRPFAIRAKGTMCCADHQGNGPTFCTPLPRARDIGEQLFQRCRRCSAGTSGMRPAHHRFSLFQQVIDVPCLGLPGHRTYLKVYVRVCPVWVSADTKGHVWVMSGYVRLVCKPYSSLLTTQTYPSRYATLLRS